MSDTEQNLGDMLASEPPVLVTGAAGFIGHRLTARLLRAGARVVGFDNLSDYYDVRLKRARLADLAGSSGFRFVEGDLADARALAAVCEQTRPRRIVNLAAQAGVRYSLINPEAYVQANLVGFANLLEQCRRLETTHLVYASSSSVFGGNRRLPFRVDDPVDHPVSLYAATKKANELMAHSYSHLYGLPATGLRFFTVYGPWGRPDMAYWLFADAILDGRPIDVNNGGDMARDFTYIDDVVNAVLRLIPRAPAPDPGFDRLAPTPDASWAPHRVYNIGNTRPERLTTLIALIETALGRKAVQVMRPMPPGDVLETCADVTSLTQATGWRPVTPLAEGVPRFVEWFRWWRAQA